MVGSIAYLMKSRHGRVIHCYVPGEPRRRPPVRIVFKPSRVVRVLNVLAVSIGSATRSSAAAATQDNGAKRPWTILVYGAADNNADGPILQFLRKVRDAIDDDSGIE